MTKQQIELAKKFNVANKLMKLELELLDVPYVEYEKIDEGIFLDIGGFLDDMPYVIMCIKYNIDISLDNYYAERRRFLKTILKIAKKYGLTRTEDRIEDYGEHFYIVLQCDSTWKT